MGKEVSFSFSSEDEKRKFQDIAKSRGQTLAQFAKWCVYKYQLDCHFGALASRAYRARRRDATVRSYLETSEGQTSVI